MQRPLPVGAVVATVGGMGDDDDEPLFSNIMELIAEQKRNDIKRREQERLDQREAREVQMEEQREERRMQYQMQSQRCRCR